MAEAHVATVNRAASVPVFTMRPAQRLPGGKCSNSLSIVESILRMTSV